MYHFLEPCELKVTLWDDLEAVERIDDRQVFHSIILNRLLNPNRWKETVYETHWDGNHDPNEKTKVDHSVSVDCAHSQLLLAELLADQDTCSFHESSRNWEDRQTESKLTQTEACELTWVVCVPDNDSVYNHVGLGE